MAACGSFWSVTLGVAPERSVAPRTSKPARSNEPSGTNVLDGKVGTLPSRLVTPASAVMNRMSAGEELPKDAKGLPLDKWKTCDPGRGYYAPGSGSGSPGLIEMGAASAPAAVSTVKSFCAEAVWDVQANVTDTRTNTKVEVHQDVAIPHPIDKIDAACNRS